MRIRLLLVICLIVTMTVSCKDQGMDKEHYSRVNQEIRNILISAGEKLNSSEQAIIITSQEDNPEYVKLYTVEKMDGIWQDKFETIKATIGRNGFADIDMKKEGDGKTPSGIFKLGLAFGYNKTINSKMPYRQSAENDFWIDDVDSNKYNTWVHGDTEAKSFERMKRKDHLYKYGVVVEYNTNPVLKGKGSAIFLHVWRAPGKKTAGCAAMPENDIVKILGWLDPEQEPVVLMGKESSFI